jgi:uncharacterized protein YjdB
MKRLLVYFAVLVGCLFVGLTTYYMLKNYEHISITASSGNKIYLNVGETETITIVHENQYETTEITPEIIGDKESISFNQDTGLITALKGGSAKLVITSTNENFGPFTFEIYVGDGNKTCPYYIKTDEDL